jgi:hypothetical protein
MAQVPAKLAYETYITSGHSNNADEVRGWGYGWISNNVVVDSFSSHSDAWVNPETPNQINWSAGVSLGGSFIPDDGHVTPEMALALLLGSQSHDHHRVFERARWDGAGGGYVTYDPILTVNVNALGHVDPGDGEKGWLPSGWGNVSLNVSNGYVTHSNSQLTILDNAIIDGTKSWSAYFNFNGISIPDKMEFMMVPEPSSAILLALLAAQPVLFRRRTR